MFFFQVKPDMKQAVPREYHTLWDIYRCGALFTLNMLFYLFSGVVVTMQTLSADITTKTVTSEPRLSQSERVQGFEWDVASCGLLEKENVLLFLNVFYSFCF